MLAIASLITLTAAWRSWSGREDILQLAARIRC